MRLSPSCVRIIAFSRRTGGHVLGNPADVVELVGRD